MGQLCLRTAASQKDSCELPGLGRDRRIRRPFLDGPTPGAGAGQATI